jgi:hypothetical protein
VTTLAWLALACAWVPSALAGQVYVNGVRADTFPETTLHGCEVRFDAQGNTWITAPGYRVSVQPTAPVPAGGDLAVAGTLPTPVAAPMGPGEVARETWWMVTEDNDSQGHVVEVAINGVVVRTVRSGEGQVVLDLSPFLRMGSNAVVITAQPGNQPGGGLFTIYVGRGDNRSGTVRLDAPSVRYQRRALDSPNGGTKQYTISVP